VTADEAIQDAHNTKHAKLKNVSADLTTKTGGWINIEAPTGFLAGDTHKLNLSGKVSMFTDTAYEAHTNLVYIDLTNGIVVGPHRVTGQGPLGTFVADEFRVERPKVCNPKQPAPAPKQATKCVPAGADAADSRIYLYGNVHMTLYEKQKSKKT
jgi:hypothetical protein